MGDTVRNEIAYVYLVLVTKVRPTLPRRTEEVEVPLLDKDGRPYTFQNTLTALSVITLMEGLTMSVSGATPATPLYQFNERSMPVFFAQ